jgi:hypothetical protein
MPRVGFESTIPVFEQAKTFHLLDLAATIVCILNEYFHGVLLCLRPAHRAICEPIVETKCGSLDASEPCGPSRPVTGIALPYTPLSNPNT